MGLVAVVLMLSAITPATDPTVVFATHFSVELMSSVLLGAVYLAGLLLAGLRWVHLVLGLPARGSGHDRGLLAAGAAVCSTSVLLVPVDALRILGSPPQDVLRPDVWLTGVTPDAWASLVTSWAGVAVVVLSRVAERRLWRPVLLAAPVVVVLAPSWLGHSRSETPRVLMIAADAVHLTAAAWWLSGIVVIAGLLLPGHRRAGADVVARALIGFSSGARVTVVAVAVSGIVMAALILDRPGDLVDSGWGRALLIKIVLVGAIVSMARWNEVSLRTAVDRAQDEAERWAVLRMTLVSELVLLVAVVTLTGFVTQMSPG